VTNLSLYLAESADKYPEASALVCDDMTTSYSALGNDVARFADYLTEGGLQPGDRVGVMLPNGPEFAVVFYGVLRAGGVVVPLNPPLHARAVEFCLKITDARMLFVTPRHAVANTIAAVATGTQPVEIGSRGIAQLTAGFAGRTAPVSQAACDTAVVLPTTETAGAHTVQLAHGELVSSQATTAELLLPLGRNDVVMGCLPMRTRLGITCGLLAAISPGRRSRCPALTLRLTPRQRSKPLRPNTSRYSRASPRCMWHCWMQPNTTTRTSLRYGSVYRRAGRYPWAFGAESKTGSDACSWMQTSCWPRARPPHSVHAVCDKDDLCVRRCPECSMPRLWWLAGSLVPWSRV
jgi:acyl-CoA synthetase (AMP-forming)/AMP-acid ligase II